MRRATDNDSNNESTQIDFYPRSPCGERHFVVDGHTVHITNFYPRSPCGERLQRQIEFERYSDISIHALLAESDSQPSRPPANRQTFLSTLSLRRATHGCYSLRHSAQFLSTLSLRRATRMHQLSPKAENISIHALLAESDPRGCPASSPRPYFYPRSPCGERRVWTY